MTFLILSIAYVFLIFDFESLRNSKIAWHVSKIDTSGQNKGQRNVPNFLRKY